MSEIKANHLLRLMRLRRAGLSYRACSIVLNLDYGLAVSAEQVRYVCQLVGDVVPA